VHYPGRAKLTDSLLALHADLHPKSYSYRVTDWPAAGVTVVGEPLRHPPSHTAGMRAPIDGRAS
jgi:hypothetical protein